MHDTLSRQLTPSQREAVFHKKGPLLVLAGPGSGKTRVITHRIAALIDSGIRPYNICAITFTNKAAEEMRQRAIALGASAGAHITTFHSLCVRILRQYASEANIKSSFSIYDEADQARCIRRAVKDCELDTKNFPPARMLDAISTLKNNLKCVDSFTSNADDYFTKILARVYAKYQQILSENNAMDFDDLLMQTAFLLRDCPEVCRELGNRFEFLLIDEYQDTNHAQYKIAKAIVSAHNNICVTGDPDQSIYRWRGADISNILDFEDDWPDAVVVKLEENFRSTANIVDLADKLISFNQKRKLKKLIPTKPAGKEVIISAFEDESEEAHEVAQQVKELIDKGASPDSIAIFYRVNSASREFEEAFITSKIPYQIVRGLEFYSRKEIRDLLAYLKILVNPDDEIALLRVINTPARGIGKTTIDRIRSYATSNNITFYDGLKRAGSMDSLSKGTKAKVASFVNMMENFKTDLPGPVEPIARRICVESGLAEFLKATNEVAFENINELVNAAAQYDRSSEKPTVLDYLQQIALFTDADSYDSKSGQVALMTLHTAKGLEFDNVFIVGVEDGLLPHERGSGDEDEIEEERRLFFVGITRAKTWLHISYARYRTIRGQMLRTIPSQFLYELGIDFDEMTNENQYEYDFDDDSESISRSTPHFVTNQLVRHKVFGLGRVREFIDIAENSIVVVKFYSGQTKSLLVKYAGLSKIEKL